MLFMPPRPTLWLSPPEVDELRVSAVGHRRREERLVAPATPVNRASDVREAGWRDAPTRSPVRPGEANSTTRLHSAGHVGVRPAVRGVLNQPAAPSPTARVAFEQAESSNAAVGAHAGSPGQSASKKSRYRSTIAFASGTQPGRPRLRRPGRPSRRASVSLSSQAQLGGCSNDRLSGRARPFLAFHALAGRCASEWPRTSLAPAGLRTGVSSRTSIQCLRAPTSASRKIEERTKAFAFLRRPDQRRRALGLVRVFSSSPYRQAGNR